MKQFYYFKNVHVFITLFTLLINITTVKGQDISTQTLPENLEEVSQAIVFNSGRFNLLIDTEGDIKSIQLKDGKEILRTGFTNQFVLNLPGQDPVSMSKFYTSEDYFVFATADNRFYATFDIKAHPAYTAFNLVDFYGDLPVGGTMEIKLPKSDAKAKALAYDYMTADQGEDSYIKIKFEHLWERYKGNTLGGFAIYTYSTEAEEDESILQAWGNEPMPHPVVAGEWNYERALQWIEDWKVMFEDQSVMYIAPENIEELPAFEKYLDMADVTTVNFFTNMWHGGFWPKDKLNWQVDGIFGSQQALKEYSQLQRSNDRSINIHYVSGGIGKADPMYAGEHLSDEFASWVDGTLVQDITDTEKEFYFKPAEDWYTVPEVMDGATTTFGKLSEPLPAFFKYFYLQVGKELMKIKNIESIEDGTWKFEIESRGIISTTMSSHQAGTNVKGILLAYNQVYVPDNNSALFMTVTDNFAALLNDCQVSNALFDGAEIHVFDGHWGFRKFAEQVYRKIDHPVVVRTSNGREPDTGYMEYKINSTKKYLTSPVGDHNKGRASLKLERNSTTHKTVHTPATNLLAAHFMLGVQAAANGRNYSILRPDPMFGITMDELLTYGKTEELLSLLPKWKAVGKLLSEEQRQQLKETQFYYQGKLDASYTTFELRELEKDFLLAPIQMMTQDPSVISDALEEDPNLQYFHMKQEDGMYAPKEKVTFGQTIALENKYHKQSPQFIVRVMQGDEDIVQPRFRIGDSFLSVNTMIRANAEHTQYIEYRGGKQAKVYDQNWNLKEEVDVIISGKFEVEEGYNTVVLESNNNATAAVELMLFTEGNAIVVQKKNRDASLSDLTVDGVTIPNFADSVYEYTVELAVGTTQVPEINGQAKDEKASLEITTAPSVPGTSIITVTAEDTDSKAEYKVHFEIEGGGINNANLSELYLNGLVYKDFDPSTISYVIVYNEEDFPKITAYTQDQRSTYIVEGEMQFGSTITITVTSESGLEKVYTLVIKREGALSLEDSKSTIKVFKNTNRTLSIQSESKLDGKEMAVYSISGQKVFDKELRGLQDTIDVKLKGLYLVHIYDRNSRSVHKVIF
ncbi:T9SS type A sorting domain-containing protein [Flammeovirga aprica]|uniref:T9SS type A sorting domain-containing protein n=1 Tax=Flammeovirga aprica JL-4 TaxID=694437 RepID=A0A7X9RXR2_9BACT|nr:T9SS type A sorting domain-containing protein [Flammeovirga aprica]NME70713.1 T9SS type A sorting domain-containing protein [Flammeovirga aprica JL-4]